MKIGKQSNFKRCPRCNFKTFKDAKVCGQCDLNFSKFNLATNAEGITALRKHEKERVVWTKVLPVDVNKWTLFFTALCFGWAGAHLWKVGKFVRAIVHSIGLLLGAFYILVVNLGLNNKFWYNIGNISGAFWLITFSIAVIDCIEIAFNLFKVPVSLPYKEK